MNRGRRLLAPVAAAATAAAAATLALGASSPALAPARATPALLASATAAATTASATATAAAAPAVAARATTTRASPSQVDSSGTASLSLASQTSWVDPVKNNIFTMRVAVTTSLPPSSVRVIVDVYQRTRTRSDFARTLSNTFVGYIIAQPIGAALDTLHPDANGIVEINIPLAASRGQGSNLLYLPSSGAYPLSVEVRPATTGLPLARLVTTMLYTSAPVVGPKLRVAWIAPVHANPPAPSSDGSLDPAARKSISILATALAAHPAVPGALTITPDTLASLDVTDPGLVNQIGRGLAAREVLATTWVPMSLPAMLQAGLADDLSLSLTRGTDRLSRDLGTNVAGRTWVQDGPINQDALTALRGAQFDRIVLPEADLAPSNSRFTVAQPFEVPGTGRTLIRAAVADSGLGAHFFTGGDQVLAAHQLLGDLYQIYSDAPANDRGVVMVAPRSWTPTAAFLDVLLTGLEQTPVLAPTQIDEFFDSVPPTIGRGTEPLVRQVLTDDAAIRAAATDLMPDLQHQARGHLNSLDVSLPADSVSFARLDRMLLEVPFEDLAPTERRARIDALNAAVTAVTNMVTLGGPRTITLTARIGRLPLDLVSQSDEPVQVQLQIQSDKLLFPGSNSPGSAVIPMELHKGNNPIDVIVKTRTSGAFPLTLTVSTKDGLLVMTRTNFTIQSTVLSGVGIVLSVGAALFLMVWWGRHAWRTGRRGAHVRTAP